MCGGWQINQTTPTFDQYMMNQTPKSRFDPIGAFQRKKMHLTNIQN
jgi:hypothetical protein